MTEFSVPHVFRYRGDTLVICPANSAELDRLDAEAAALARWIETDESYTRCGTYQAGRRCILPRGHETHRFQDELQEE